MISRMAVFMMLGLSVVSTQAQTEKTVSKGKIIKRLPLVKLGDPPSTVKTMVLSNKQPFPLPARDPYVWVKASETAAVSRVWTVENGPRITAALVQYNNFTVELRDDHEQSYQLSRKALDAAGRQFMETVEKRDELDRIAAWKARKAEKEVADKLKNSP